MFSCTYELTALVLEPLFYCSQYNLQTYDGTKEYGKDRTGLPSGDLLQAVKGRWHGQRERKYRYPKEHTDRLCEKTGMALSENLCGRWLFWYKFSKTRFPEHD